MWDKIKGFNWTKFKSLNAQRKTVVLIVVGLVVVGIIGSVLSQPFRISILIFGSIFVVSALIANLIEWLIEGWHSE